MTWRNPFLSVSHQTVTSLSILSTDWETRLPDIYVKAKLNYSSDTPAKGKRLLLGGKNVSLNIWKRFTSIKVNCKYRNILLQQHWSCSVFNQLLFKNTFQQSVSPKKWKDNNHCLEFITSKDISEPPRVWLVIQPWLFSIETHHKSPPG